MRHNPLLPKFRLSRNLDGSHAFTVVDPHDPPVWQTVVGLAFGCAGGIFIGCLAAFIVVWLAP